MGLVHYPIYNKRMEIVATSITNLDLHDIARTATTYNLAGYFMIHPEESQQKLIREIIDYWQHGYGVHYNPDRCEAFACVALTESVASTLAEIETRTGLAAKIVVTDARSDEQSVDYLWLRQAIAKDEQPFLILFGTGWGMSREVMDQADYRLKPVLGTGEYNHLSVRSAVGIIMDRLLGEPWYLN